MRVLLTAKRGAGHFGPLIPFARAFRRAGATVVIAAPRSAAPMIHAEGFATLLFDEAPEEERDAVLAAARAQAAQAPASYVFAELFARVDARVALPGVLEACWRWRPDLVLSEISEFAGPIAAAKLGIPAISVGISQHGRTEAVAVASSVLPALDELGASIGLPPDPDGERVLGLPYFTLVPEALEEPSLRPSRAAWRFREPQERLDGDRWAPDDRPLVYVTFGSVAPTMDLFPGVYRGAIDAFSALPVRVLVTVGRDRDRDLAELGPLPDNVRVEGWVPQREVMPHAAAMVCHGGSGTVTLALAAGVPMAVVPLFADQSWNAERIEAIGAGIVLEGGAPAVAGLGDAVSKLLVDPAYRANAERVAADIRALPTVDAAPAIARAFVEDRALAAIV
jgi:UDP:flavonoid glycosyltransferase YjiC (YdhE family)